MINGTNALRQIVWVGETVGRFRLGQAAAERLITGAIRRMGYELGEEVTKDGARYLISKTTNDGVSHALEILADGTVNWVKVRGYGSAITVIR